MLGNKKRLGTVSIADLYPGPLLSLPRKCFLHMAATLADDALTLTHATFDKTFP